jgi:phosphate transport system permease protein
MKRRPMHLLQEKALIALTALAVYVPLAIVGSLFIRILVQGASRLNWGFLTSFPSRIAERAGILPAVLGSLYLILLTAVIALPVGIAAAVYLEEYGKSSRFKGLIEINIANLAGVPSVIYGLLGVEMFVRVCALGTSVLAGALTISLLVLPMVIVASREALRTVPRHLREAALALGASQLQTIARVVLPQALPGILTGAIFVVARALGETAPLIVIGAATYMAFLPTDPLSDFTVLPIQIFNWLSRPQAAFQANASAAIVVLLATLLVLNVFAIVLRNRYRQKST